MSPETIGIIVTTAGLIWAITTQIRDQRAQRQVLAFDLYERVSSAFSAVLMQETTDETLQAIWEPWEPARLAELRRINVADRASGVWDALRADERRQYRYTRRAFDVLELASEANRRELLGADAQMWHKWQGSLNAWVHTRWAEFVIDPEREVQRPRFHPAFVRRVEAARQATGHAASIAATTRKT